MDAWEMLADQAKELEVIKNPGDIAAPFAIKIGKKDQEHFIVAMLNGASGIIGYKIVTIGLTNRTLVHPREVFREAIKRNASSIIIGHNHPSGSLDPSIEDDSVTKRLKEAGEILGIAVLDHIIVRRTGYYSYLSEGKL
jgi:DNA repair protein RadC